MFGKRLLVFARHLFALALPAHAIELEVAIVEYRQHLALVYRFAGAHQRLSNVALERCDDGTLHRAFHRRARRNPELALGKAQEQSQEHERDCAQLVNRPPRTD